MPFLKECKMPTKLNFKKYNFINDRKLKNTKIFYKMLVID